MISPANGFSLPLVIAASAAFISAATRLGQLRIARRHLGISTRFLAT
jgi:hypothetical protein